MEPLSLYMTHKGQVSARYKTQLAQPKETHVVQNVKQKQTTELCVSSSLFLIYCKTAAASDTMKALFPWQC